jgi:hypothetical protein
MSQLAPPRQTQGLAYDDGDRIRRLRLRLWQVMLSTLTVLATAWVCTFWSTTLGKFAAITALLIAKHVLVAILLMGLGVDGRRNS